MPDSRISLQELWRLGCRDAELEPGDQQRFAAMARSRFHTFQLGIQHALQQPDANRFDGLVRGLAVELAEAPGLKRLWQVTALSTSEAGEQVNLQLERLTHTTH